MTRADSKRPRLKLVPALVNEPLYIGIDVGKLKHVAGFVSTTLLQRYERFEGCPAFPFEQSRDGFRTLIERIRAYTPLESCYVLMEQTGHYHKSLEQYLLDLDISVYIMHVQRRPTGMLKTDKRDALSLANHLYNQLECGIQIADKLHLVRRALPPTEAAAQLKGLTRHRYELIQESTRRKNKLTAICDEVFPEFTQVFKNPNLQTALAFREQFPTPQVIATASMTALQGVRGTNRSLTDAKLMELQRLAAQSIGMKEANRLRGLVFEQGQLIRELHLIQKHLEELDAEIGQIVEHCREGKILTSIPPIGPLQAAMIIAAIGSIGNFESAAKLKSYFGWAPIREQTGITFDRTHLTQGGVRTMKKTMFLLTWTAIRTETQWALLYHRLVPRLCHFDERTQAYRGKGKVFGHIAGRLITLIYALLKKDYETLSHLAPGAKPPEPILYDPEIHQRHRQGQYQALKVSNIPQSIVQSSNG